MAFCIGGGLGAAAPGHVGADAMIATVVGVAGDLTGKRIALGNKPITLGRGDENGIVLTTPSASRVHAELRLQDGGYVLHDRGSSNGTWVNGERVTERVLQHGDQISIGDEVFRFEAADALQTVQGVTMQAAEVQAKPPAPV